MGFTRATTDPHMRQPSTRQLQHQLLDSGRADDLRFVSLW